MIKSMLSKPEIYRKTPFVIGAFDNLFSEPEAKRLREVILRFDSLMLMNGSVVVDSDGKRKYEPKDGQHFLEFRKMLDVELLKKIQYIESPHFKYEVLSKIRSILVFNRFDVRVVMGLLDSIFRTNFTWSRIELSVLADGVSISPHTDGLQKLFSGLFYLPSGQEECETGTRFLKDLPPNLHNLPFNHELSNSADDEYTELMTLPFSSKKFYFFLRNSLAWHDVPAPPQRTEPRISVNYNIFCENINAAVR
jgi:hypothetical protein